MHPSRLSSWPHRTLHSLLFEIGGGCAGVMAADHLTQRFVARFGPQLRRGRSVSRRQGGRERRNTGSLDELVATYGDAVLPLELDVTDKLAVFESVKRAKEHFGRLDVIVNNAGYAQIGAIEKLTEQQLRHQFETNVFGSVWVIQAALPYLREQGSGHIMR